MTATTDYFLGETSVEGERLLQMARAFAPDTRALLDRIGVPAGSRAVDVGCGPLGALDVLSDSVGPEGSVVGLERADTFADTARRTIEALGLGNVEFVRADARDSGLPAGSFDLAHERLVLIQAPEPREVLASMVELVRPDGVVVAEELDAASWFCYPAHTAWDTLIGAFHAVATTGGADFQFGRRLPELLRSVGLVDVQVEARVHAPRPGEYLRTHLIALLQSVRADVLNQGALSETEWEDLVTALRTHLEDPDTVVVGQTMIQAWGRKPSR